MDLQHILYGTVGTTFEDFLTGEELDVMSRTSMTGRLGVRAQRFRLVRETFFKEFERYKTNNGFTGAHIDKFLSDVPIRAIFKDIAPYDKRDVDLLFDVIKPGLYARFLVSMEFADFESLKSTIIQFREVSAYYAEAMDSDYTVKHTTMSALPPPGTTMYQLKMAEYAAEGTITLVERPPAGQFPQFMVDHVYNYDLDEYSLYAELCDQASMRLRPDIVEFLFTDPEVEFNYSSSEYYTYYGITKELRDLFIKYNTEFIDFLHEKYDFEDDAYALVDNDWNGMEVFLITTTYAIRCRDKDLYTAYYKQVNGNVEDGVLSLFDRPEYYYMHDPYDIDELMAIHEENLELHQVEREEREEEEEE